MAAEVYIDGVEVTNVCIEGSATRRLNRPAQATIRVPITDAIGDVGSRLKVVIDGDLFFHGMILMIEDEADEDFGYTTYNASDPMEMWIWRPARDFEGPTPGNLIDPSFLFRKVSGPQIIEEILLASENIDEYPFEAEGPLFVSLGSFETGGVDLSGAPTNWPVSIGEMVNLLTSTGEVDVVLTPIDSGGNMAQVDCYNGDYGTDRSGSVFFDYGMGNYNVRRVRQAVDGSNIVNKVRYHIGPKRTITRFQTGITGENPCLYYPPGGSIVEPINEVTNPLGARRLASRAAYGARMDIHQYDVDVLYREDDPCDFDLQDPSLLLYRRLWQMESWIRCEPRRLVHVTPTRGTAIGDFDIGDLVTVRAGAFFRGGFSGAQRVYEYTISWDSDGVLELGELQTSADQEGV
jgi:hypothetical protein